MKLLEAEPQPAPSAPEEPPRQTLPAAPSEVAEARSCGACGATMAPDQDWCLSCGAAAAGPAGRRPGWRAAASVIGLTLVLVVGAVAASYAALTDDPPATPPQAVAQAPATEPAATSSTPTDAPPAEAPTATDPAGGTQPSDLPTVPTPGGETPAVTPSPTPVTPTPTPGDDGGEVPASPATPTDRTPNAPELVPIALADGAVIVYDPYGRATATGDPGRAVDDDAATSWYVDPKDPALIGVGLTVDLGQLRAVKAIEVETLTPGFTLELYGTDEAEPPPNILDTRWTHIRDVKSAGEVDPAKADDVKGRERIVLGAGATRYRNLVLWFTVPPTERPRLRITELKLYR